MKFEFGVCYTFFSAQGNPVKHRIIAHSVEEMLEWKRKIAEVGYMYESTQKREANKYNNLYDGWTWVC